MNAALTKMLIANGVIIILCGFIAGFLVGAVALEQLPGNKEDWLLAHMEGLLNGMFLLVIAGIGGFLALGRRSAGVMTYSFIGMAYCNLIFGFMRGATGAKGYALGGDFANEITALAGMLGVPLGIIALLLVLVGALKSAKPELQT
jgi:hydroxylaminobenzene mutase